MNRDTNSLGNHKFDLLIIGGGINGACAAWDASLRGLSVALLDKGDFGSVTSANSLKIIHGGLRYLQKADIRRMREATHEQHTLMRIAPHLVHPIPFLIPTYGHLKRGRGVLSLALKMHRFLAYNQNPDKQARVTIPPGRIISADDCLQIFPSFSNHGLTGGMIWYDCQVHNSERLTLSFLMSATELGAQLANYAEVKGFIIEGGRIRGVQVVDVLSGKQLELRARVVLNAAGPWVCELNRLVQVNHRPLTERPNWALAVNLVTRQLTNGVAVGIKSKATLAEDPVCDGDRYLFLVPWRGYTLIGTSYKVFDGCADNSRVDENDLQKLIDECNKACPTLDLSLDDVTFYHHGLLPLKNRKKPLGATHLATHHRIIDHKIEEGIEGLISIFGVKYTTARAVAQKAIDLVFERLGSTPPPCKTFQVPIYGGESVNQVGTDETFPECLSEEAVNHLLMNYGSRAREVAVYTNSDPEWARPVVEDSPVLRCEVLHAIRAEMAVKLADVVLRRTDLGTAGRPSKSCLENVAEIMANELDWDTKRCLNEIEEVMANYAALKMTKEA